MTIHDGLLSLVVLGQTSGHFVSVITQRIFGFHFVEKIHTL